jgi:hypothetical protein
MKIGGYADYVKPCQESGTGSDSIGFVHQRKGKYVSDETLQRRREQKKRNQRILEGLLAINEAG